ncbi:MAG: TetR/AcrR family transcriptional regulator [Bacillus sp. (in: firmicutes)]
MIELRERIIATSLKLFEKHGYHGVSVHEIVEASGTSKGGFYHHFHSKDELLYVIHDYFISYVLKKAEEAIETTDSTPTEKLHQIIHSFVKVFDLYKPHISVFYQESNYLKTPYIEHIAKKRKQYRDIIYCVLEEGRNAGEFREELPIEITGMGILGIVNWTYKWYRPDGGKSIEEIADIFIDFIFQGLWTEQAKSEQAYHTFLLDRKKMHQNESQF